MSRGDHKDASAPRALTSGDLKAIGLRVGELAAILGVHRTTLSDLLSGKTGRPTPGSHALVYIWPHLPEEIRASLLSGEHLGGNLGP